MSCSTKGRPRKEAIFEARGRLTGRLTGRSAESTRGVYRVPTDAMKWDTGLVGERGQAGVGAGLCHTGTTKLNWRCGRRSAVVRVEWYQMRTRDVQRRIRTTWASGGGDEGGQSFCQSYSVRGDPSVVGGAEREKRKEETHTDVCCAVYAHEGAGSGQGRATASTGGKEGG